MNIKQLAKQAGLDWHKGWPVGDDESNLFAVFAELIAAHEREECLKCYSPDDTATDWADKIRARSKT